MLSNIDAQKRYREHTLQLWKGDRSFQAGIVLSNEAIMMQSTRYIGFRLAFAIIGVDILLIVLLVCFVIIEIWFVSLLEEYWLTLVLFFVLGVVQAAMTRLVFLQRADDEDRSLNIFRKRKTYLGLDNRRVFHVVFYFSMFVNVIQAALAGLFRLLDSVVIGLFLIGRVDRCAMQRDWESRDGAFTAYISFLQLEVSHTHPVVITFCHLLNELIAQRKRDSTPLPGPAENIYAVVNEGCSQTTSEGPSSCRPAVPTVDRVMSSRVRNRWFLALTLTRNPTLIPLRKKPKDEISSILVLNVG
ncbi:stimulated by retinoic acid gene 6 protein-like isoform X2 [Asterias amurensis]|uniref:stimulated by retinoic acid gene 6 protein-like isoform X2 n=1 Tax=Asterias amurensis TaxID=7602 RepID=UPI003AB4A0CA